MKLILEIIGVSVIALGTVYTIGWGTAWFFKKESSDEEVYHKFRKNLGRVILLGLEFLVAADIINSVAVEPTLKSVAVLACIVLVRTFLSFALEVEMNGRWPWKESEGKK